MMYVHQIHGGCPRSVLTELFYMWITVLLLLLLLLFFFLFGLMQLHGYVLIVGSNRYLYINVFIIHVFENNRWQSSKLSSMQ